MTDQSAFVQMGVDDVWLAPQGPGQRSYGKQRVEGYFVQR
jgi:hypothetical protein